MFICCVIVVYQVKCSITLWREANGGLVVVVLILLMSSQHNSYHGSYKLFAQFIYIFEYYSKTKSKHKNILIVVAPNVDWGISFAFFTGVNDFP